jgi:hypothetical protein
LLDMSEALSTHATLDGETMWRTMRVLLDRVFGVLEREWLDLDAHVHKRQMIGTLPNRDTLVDDTA